jgi:signal transduction histidine kinase
MTPSQAISSLRQLSRQRHRQRGQRQRQQRQRRLPLTRGLLSLRRPPLRVRLVLGFAVAMLVVLTAAGAFVYWRVAYALDARLDSDLAAEATDLQRGASLHTSPSAALADLGVQGRDAQYLDRSGRVLDTGTGLRDRPALLSPTQLSDAGLRPVSVEQGGLFSKRGQHLRITAQPVRFQNSSQVAIAVAAVRLDQRDEALRELLGQLALANLAALTIASFVGYRLARAALQPVERYRTRAEQIAAGATGVRLDVPRGTDDEITRLGHTLNTMLAAQEHAAAAQQQFIDDASHELRTPLTVLAAEVELALQRTRSPAEYEQTLRRISADVSELVELADDLLTLGAQGSSSPQAQPVPAAELLREAAERARATLPPQDGRRVCLNVPDGLEAQADPALLRRALGNLVDNAVRYGEGTITLTGVGVAGTSTSGAGTSGAPMSGAAMSGSRPDATVLAVHDDGTGIAADFLPHAVERFRQAQESRTGAGRGLGLALVDAIVTAHHGQFRLCSNGTHHRQPTSDPRIDALPCTHPESGTTASLLLPPPGRDLGADGVA